MRKKVLAGLLALVMLLSLLPVAAFAAEGDGTGSTDIVNNDGLVTNKTVEVKEDGTFDIELEAYVTGEVTSSTTTTPTDIVLVLDVSGSMADCIVCGDEVGDYDGDTHAVSYNYTATYNIINNRNQTYYVENNGNYSQVHYCSSCNGWYNEEHYNVPIIGHVRDGEKYTPRTDANSTDGTTFYTRTEVTEKCTSRMASLKDAVTSFINSTAAKNAEITEGDKHRIAIVKFAGSYKNSIGNNTGSTQVVRDFTEVTGSGQEAGTNTNSLITTVNSLTAEGATSADYGLTLADEVLKGTDNGNSGTTLTGAKEGHSKIVIMFTDGEPNHYSGFDKTVAATAVNKAKSLKDDGATVFSISVLPDSDPSDTSEDMNKYMHGVSSNYPQATAENNSWQNLDLGTRESGSDYYKKASSKDELVAIFKAISNSVGSATIDLGTTAVVKDIIGTGFTLPDNFNAAESSAKIEIYTAGYAGDGVFNDPVAAGSEITANISGNTVDVTGFDYSDNYVVDASADGKVETSGKKLIVKITGVEIDPAKYQDGQVFTNGAASGIYDGHGALVENFPRPFVMLGKKSYVVDYAKDFEMNIADWNQERVGHLATTPEAFETANPDNLDLTNGAVSRKDTTTFTYTPQTMSWNGYDTFYAFGHTKVDDGNTDLWSQINVIPANNVYYEDDFASVEADGTKNEAIVGIEYGTGWSVVYDNKNTTTGSDNGNTETPDNAVHGGWVAGDTGLSDDTDFSNGSATMANTRGASASFSFKGTGVDIYSYTDMKSGIIVGVLTKDGETVATKTLMVDNLAESGECYQIPVLAFDGLEEDATYTVKLTVNRAVILDEHGERTDDYRSTFYLDGIRIYNPLGSTVSGEVADAYDPDNSITTPDAETGVKPEIQSMFAEVKDLLAAGAEGTDDAVFIDKDASGTVAVKDYYSSDVYTTYGPENEVYLAPGQSIAFKIANYDGSAKYFVGLKSLTGDAVTANFTKADGGETTTITHTTDLYYAITPTADGKVQITNGSTGDKTPILSLTKIQTMGPAPTTFALMALSAEEATTYATAFSAFSLTEYEEPVVEEPVEPETPTEPEIPEEPETPTEPEIPEEPETPTEPEQPDIDIEIENPDPEPEKPVQKPNHQEALNKLVKNLFNAIFGWFGRK